MKENKQSFIPFPEYIRKEKNLIILVFLSVIVCWAHNAFTDNIRIDGEYFINNPGTLQGWLSIGRFGMLPVKWILGNLNYNPYFSGALFIVLFSLLCVLLLYLIENILPGIKYRWVFVLLFVSSNTWAYMFYFTMMWAEVAFALLAVTIALIVYTKYAMSREFKTEAPRIACVFLLVIAFGCYQAVVPFFVSGAAMCILLWLNAVTESGRAQDFKAYLLHSLNYVVPFLTAYAIYSLIAKLWFTSGDYLSGMSMWQSRSFLTCLAMIGARIAQMLGGSPELYSFAFPAGCILCAGIYFSALKNKRLGICLPLYELTWLVLLASPFLLLICLGGNTVPRMQFSLQLVSAFMCVYALNKLDLTAIKTAAAAATVLISIYQYSVLQRLYYTDDIREKQDEAFAFEISSQIEGEYGDTDYPVVFVGKHEAGLNNACLKTDVFGASLFGWDYDSLVTSSGSPRCTGFIEAVTGKKYPEPTDEQKLLACFYAQEMPSYPEEGSISLKDGMIIIKLSD